MESDNSSPRPVSAATDTAGNAGPEEVMARTGEKPGPDATGEALQGDEGAFEGADDDEEGEDDEFSAVALEPEGPIAVGDTGERPPAYLEPEPPEVLPELDGVTESGEPAEISPRLLDPDAVKVVHRLRQHNFEAYFVGGCVRDLLVGLKPKDFDIATSATPNEVRDLFRNCRLIGRRFRLAHVYFKGGKIIEVSTFRRSPTDLAAVAEPDTEAPNEETAAELDADAESEGADLLITTDNVWGSAEEDARRRDFTVNGLFYDVGAGKVIDFVRGRRDLDRRVIRTISDPEIRLREDPVRLIRGVRFAAKLDFDIEPRTYAAMEGAVEDLPRCAPPRLLEDTFRILRGGTCAQALKLLSALDALQVLLPPVAEFMNKSGPQGQERFYAHARALDSHIKQGQAFEDAVLLATLLLPLSQAAPVEDETLDGKPHVAQVVEELLSELVRTARLPRRIAERTRMILFAQKTLQGTRRRRGSLASFRRHPLFGESLAVFELSVEATGEFADELAKWKAGGAPEPVAGAAGGPEVGRKRRRRRRRRGGPPGSGGEGGGPAGEGGAGSGGGTPPNGTPPAAAT